jgi:hypothetical protein
MDQGKRQGVFARRGLGKVELAEGQGFGQYVLLAADLLGEPPERLFKQQPNKRNRLARGHTLGRGVLEYPLGCDLAAAL